jgi:hypothetical protein
MLTSMSGTRDAWPTRLVVISGALLVAVFFEMVASVVAALALPSGGWMSFSTIISPAPGTTASPSSVTPPHITTVPGQMSSIHDQLAVASQWAAPVPGMLILAAVVLVAHIVGTTDAASYRRLNRQMSLLCRSAAVLAALMFVAGVIGIVTDVWGTSSQGVQLHAPELATHVIGTVFAAVATWLAIGSVAELRRHVGSAESASNQAEA